MDYKPGDSVTVEFTTQVFATGVATNADSTPTGTFNRNGTDDGAVTVTVTNIDTGRYKAVWTIPATYVPGDVLNLSVAATVSTIAGKAVVWHAKLGYGVVASGTAAAGGASVITLETALGVDNACRRARIALVSGTGAGQSRGIAGYVNSTLVVTVDRAWVTNPDNTTVYVILYEDALATDISGRADVALVEGVDATNQIRDAILSDATRFAGANVDAAVSSRSTYAGGDTAGVTTLLTRVTAAVALASTLSTVAGYLDTEIADIKSKTDNLPSDPADQSLIMAAIAALNNLSSAQAQTAAAAALTAYAPATAAAMAISGQYPRSVAIAAQSFAMTDASTHEPLVGLTDADFTKLILKDGGAFAAMTGTVVEKGGGAYVIDISSGEMNAKIITVALSATGADALIFTMITTS